MNPQQPNDMDRSDSHRRPLDKRKRNVGASDDGQNEAKKYRDELCGTGPYTASVVKISDTFEYEDVMGDDDFPQMDLVDEEFASSGEKALKMSDLEDSDFYNGIE